MGGPRGLDVGAAKPFHAAAVTSHRRGHPSRDVPTIRSHWPEYASEALCLALFIVSAAAIARLLRQPLSPLASWMPAAALQRVPMGIAMGVTLVAIVYSPLGRRSGAHMNPALTLTFLRLGKIAPLDAAAYVLAQFAGGAAGIVAATALLGGLPADPAVNFVATVPRPAGPAVAVPPVPRR